MGQLLPQDDRQTFSAELDSSLNEAHLDTQRSYLQYINRKRLFLTFSLLLMGVISVFSMTVGSVDLSGYDVWRSLLSKTGLLESGDPFKEAVIWHLRFPRIVMAVIAGAGLAVSGTVMQGVTRNPLVSPFTIGTSSSAAFGASIVIIMTAGAGVNSTVLIIAGAFVASLICTFIVFGLSRVKGNSSETLILSGVAMMYLFSAMTSMIHYFASEEDLKAMVSWTFGSLSEVSWPQIAVTSGVLIILFPVMTKLSSDLNIMMSEDDETSASLGIKPSMIRTLVLITSTLVTATIISFTGIIGFIGLISPHIARFIIGADHWFLTKGSAIIGAIILLAADMVGGNILSPMILPIGIVVSFLGVPLFIFLMMNKNESYWA